MERVEFEGNAGGREDVLASLGIGPGGAVGRGDSDGRDEGEAEAGAGAGGVLGKRKRREDREVAELEEDLRLPATWEQRLRKSGSSAVAVFVDAASMQKAFKECRRVVKGRVRVEWKSAEVLGEKREYFFQCWKDAIG